jgi:DNA-binding winged helix-turn-helix (wHTH) protein
VKVSFEGFLLDRDARRLTRGNEDVHLSPKAFDLLVLLLESRPAVVEKATIRARLWPGVHVVEASLTNLVTEIRGEFGAAVGTRVVRTVHGVGYAFGGDVSEPAAPGIPLRDSPYAFVYQDRPIVLAPGEHLIGRDPASSVWIDSDSVSRRHALVVVPAAATEGAVTIEDLGSTNGTFIGGRRIARRLGLADGDRVRVGEVSLTFRARVGGEAKTKKVRHRSS